MADPRNNLFKKFYLLMWTHFLQEAYNPGNIAYQKLFTALACCVIALLRYTIQHENGAGKIYQPCCWFSHHGHQCSAVERKILERMRTHFLAYSPDDAKVGRLLGNLSTLFKGVIRYQNKKTLRQAFRNASIFAAVQFDDGIAHSTRLPRKLDVVLRFPNTVDGRNQSKSSGWSTNELHKEFDEIRGPRVNTSASGEPPYYYESGFLTLQQAFVYYLLPESSRDKFPRISLRRFPYAPWKISNLTPVSLYVIINVIFFLHIIPYAMMLKHFGAENETSLVVLLKVGGMPKWLQWLVWFLTSVLLFMSIPLAITIVVASVNWLNGMVFPSAGATYIFLLLFLYTCSLISTAFLISHCFRSSNELSIASFLASLVGVSTFLMSSVSFNCILLKSYIAQKIPKYIFAMINNNALAYGFKIIVYHEGLRQEMNNHNIWIPMEENMISFGDVLLILFFDGLMYVLFGLYVDALLPGQYDTPKPWYLFEKSSKGQESNPLPPSDTPLVEPPANSDYYVAIEIRKLTKIFGTHKALKSIDLKIYKNMTTVLMGPNGSGKSVLVKLLTGLYRATSGTIYYSNSNIKHCIQNVRQNLGISFQETILFEDFTPLQNLRIFCKFRGYNIRTSNIEANQFIRDLELDSFAHQKAKHLTVHARRKLSIAIAFCGNPDIVIFDEPTRGLDRTTSSMIQNFIENQKNDRTVLIFSFDSDLAETVADKIAVITNGELQCYGSIEFLRSEYGTHYELKFVRGSDYRSREIVQIIRAHVHNFRDSAVRRESNVLFCYLPENTTKYLDAIAKEIEENNEQLGIEEWTITVITLKHIVDKVCTTYDNRFMIKKKRAKGDLVKSSSLLYLLSYLGGEIHGYKLLYQQYLAMFRKLFVMTNRYWIIILLQIVIPGIFVVIDAGSQLIVGKDLPSLHLSLNIFKDTSPISLVSGNRSDTLLIEYVKNLDKSEYRFVEDIGKELLYMTKTKYPVVRSGYIAGVGVGNASITAWFNGEGYHAAALSHTLVLQALVRHLSPDFDGIEFHNHPLAYNIGTLISMLGQETVAVTWFLVTAWSISIGLFAWPLILERVCQFKHRQISSGLSVWVFWISFLVYDLLVFIIVLSVFVIAIHFVSDDYYGTVAILVLTTAFGFASLVLVFLLSLMINTPIVCLVIILAIGISTGYVLPAADRLLYEYSTPMVYKILTHIFMLSPFYCMGSGLSAILKAYRVRKVCVRTLDVCFEHFTKQQCIDRVCKVNKKCCPDYYFFFNFSAHGILTETVYSLCSGVILFCLIVLYDSGTMIAFWEGLKKARRRRKNRNSIPVTYLTTKGKALHEEYTVVLQNVEKNYPQRHGVQDITLGLKDYECFGLLGLSGSGKSTIFRLIMGMEKPNRGKIWVCKKDTGIQTDNVRKTIGYCPQKDCLMNNLTVKETLMIFCLIRGIPTRQSKKVVHQLEMRCALQECLDKYMKQASVCERSKVGFAVSMVGDPPLLCLDEPTIDMDPVSRRQIWDVILKLRNLGKCIILITSNMAECEALCTSAGILLKGKFECVGSMDELKSEYTKGYTFTVRTRGVTDFETLHAFLEQHLHKTNLRRHMRALAVYDVEDSAEACKIYTLMEEQATALNIDTYTIQKNNLEQMFRMFTTEPHLRF